MQVPKAPQDMLQVLEVTKKPKRANISHMVHHATNLQVKPASQQDIYAILMINRHG